MLNKFCLKSCKKSLQGFLFNIEQDLENNQRILKRYSEENYPETRTTGLKDPKYWKSKELQQFDHSTDGPLLLILFAKWCKIFIKHGEQDEAL